MNPSLSALESRTLQTLKAIHFLKRFDGTYTCLDFGISGLEPEALFQTVYGVADVLAPDAPLSRSSDALWEAFRVGRQLSVTSCQFPCRRGSVLRLIRAEQEPPI